MQRCIALLNTVVVWTENSDRRCHTIRKVYLTLGFGTISALEISPSPWHNNITAAIHTRSQSCDPITSRIYLDLIGSCMFTINVNVRTAPTPLISWRSDYLWGARSVGSPMTHHNASCMTKFIFSEKATFSFVSRNYLTVRRTWMNQRHFR